MSRRYWCNKPQPQVAALAAAVHPAANAFHLSDTGLYVVHNPKLPPATATPAEQQPDGPTPPAAAAQQIAAGVTGVSKQDGTAPSNSPTQQLRSMPRGAAASPRGPARSSVGQVVDAAVVAGIPVVTADSHSPTGPVGRVECTCETDIFRAVGLAYVPPHLRSWQ